MLTSQIDDLKTRLRKAAIQELLGRFNRVSADIKQDGTLITEADLAMQARMQAELATLFPEYRLLGEEMNAATQRELMSEAESGLWILDPLDGTSNYALGIPYFAVSLALVLRHEVKLAMVYDPARDELFHSVKGKGAWMNDRPLGTRRPETPLSKGIGLVDYKRLEPSLAQRLVSAPPYASQRSFGSVALDFCWVAAGRCHVYLHGRHSLWDYAAGLTILHEAGGSSITLDGERHRPLDLSPRSTAAALGTGLFEEWCRWLGLPSG